MPNPFDVPRPPRHDMRAIFDLIGTNDANNRQVTDLVAANADGSMLERQEYLQSLILPWASVSGETDIDDSVQTETTPWVLLTIAPATGAPIMDCVVDIDLAKATTGFAAVETSVTIQFFAARQVDGTNWRRNTSPEAALSGTNAATRMISVPIGEVRVGDTVRIYAVTSSDVASDIELPYEVRYRATAAPTVTPVAAG